ncbi:MAG: hypothetical protein AAF799_11755 [Myxococcota bacterium]
MPSDTPIDIPSVVWFSQTPSSPTLSTTAFADLKLASAPAQSPTGPTVALLGSYRLGWPYVELYPNQLPKPILIVAVSTTTGEVFSNDLDAYDPRIQPTAIGPAIADTKANAAGPARNIPGTAGYFNVDLGARLSLPPEAGYYQVFAWLDDLVTPILTVQVPANENRRAVDPSFNQVKSEGLVTIEDSSHSPNPKDGEIRTDLEFTKGSSYRVYATLPPGALQTPPVGSAPGSPILSVMTFNRQMRQFAWWSSSTAYSTMVSKSTDTFDFDPFGLQPRPNPAANVYVVTALGNLRNDVLPIFVEYQ